MILRTASETISFAKDIEGKAITFYTELSQRFPDSEDVFSSYIKESKKYITDIQRTYYSVITDAMEGGFAFELDADQYNVDAELPKNISHADAVSKAIVMEEKIISFYNDSSRHSSSLMADVPRSFNIVAKKRKSRLEKLKELA